MVDSESSADSAEVLSSDDVDEAGDAEGEVEVDPAEGDAADEPAPPLVAFCAELLCCAIALETSTDAADVTAGSPVGTVVGDEAVGPPADFPPPPEALASPLRR